MQCNVCMWGTIGTAPSTQSSQLEPRIAFSAVRLRKQKKSCQTLFKEIWSSLWSGSCEHLSTSLACAVSNCKWTRHAIWSNCQVLWDESLQELTWGTDYFCGGSSSVPHSQALEDLENSTFRIPSFLIISTNYLKYPQAWYLITSNTLRHEYISAHSKRHEKLFAMQTWWLRRSEKSTAFDQPPHPSSLKLWALSKQCCAEKWQKASTWLSLAPKLLQVDSWMGSCKKVCWILLAPLHPKLRRNNSMPDA